MTVCLYIGQCQIYEIKKNCFVCLFDFVHPVYLQKKNLDLVIDKVHINIFQDNDCSLKKKMIETIFFSTKFRAAM